MDQKCKNWRKCLVKALIGLSLPPLLSLGEARQRGDKYENNTK